MLFTYAMFLSTGTLGLPLELKEVVLSTLHLLSGRVQLKSRVNCHVCLCMSSCSSLHCEPPHAAVIFC